MDKVTSAASRDKRLIRRTLQGDKNAFATLMTYYKTRIFYFGKSFFHNDADSEDFVQDVFIKVYTHLATFRSRSSFATWLMRIAYSVAVNCVNRRKEYLPLDDTPLVDGDYTPEEKQIRKLTQEAVKDAIKELPEKYVMCIEMYFYYDLPYKEISEMTGVPLGTVKSNIYRAKLILKQKLEAIHEN